MARVTIRTVVPVDAGPLIAANRASAELHHPWVHPFTDQAGFDAYFRRLDGEATVGLVARNGETDDVIGVITTSQIFRKGFQSAYLCFYGIQGQIGRGLMTEAVRLAVAYAFDELSLHRLEANVQPGNMRSIAFVERVGFRKEGFSPKYLSIDGAWSDHERWAILKEEFCG